MLPTPGTLACFRDVLMQIGPYRVSVSRDFGSAGAPVYTGRNEGAGATRIHSRHGRRPAGPHRAREGAGGVEAVPGGPARRRVPPHDVALMGPRGNGKTVLLNWFKRACRGHAKAVDVVAVTPNDIPTREALIDVLAPPSGMAKLLPRKVGVAAVGSVEWAPPSGAVRNLGTKLTARCRRKPLAVLLDEAHTLDIEVGRTLLNTSQTSSRRRRRFCWCWPARRAWRCISAP